jgi:alanine-glyoxylate transaminase/serine-glyoxylate transaminase/serine-pyruvate transaminase
VSVSPRAWEAAATAKMPKFYFDLAAHKTSAESGQTPWTPAVAVMFQLDVALNLMEQEGSRRSGSATPPSAPPFAPA